MRPILKFELIKHLKTVSAITALVSGRIYSRYAESDKALPCITIVKAGESRDYSHSGALLLTRSTISMTVFANNDYAVEEVKDALITALHGNSIMLDGSCANVELVDDIDVMDDGLVDAGIVAGSLDFLINWEK
jgi:hypothetical protein